jgi:uncharacterized membrane protein YqjE
MAEEGSRPRNPAGHAGLLDNLLALTSALAGFFQSRWALVAQDSKAALAQLVALAACLVAAIMLFAFGYVFLIVSAIVGVARLAGVSWLWIALGAAGLHFVGALIFLFVARGRVTRPLFRATASELNKDREWLRELGKTTQPKS